MTKFFIAWIQLITELLLIPYIAIVAIYMRFNKRRVSIGLGPEPMINNVYHKLALEKYGYIAETFVISSYFITSKFDINISKDINIKTLFGKLRIFIRLIHFSFRYKILYIYFNGGPLGISSKLIWRFEPYFYKLSGVKTVVMPYGGDVQDLTRTDNLYFKHTMSQDYPYHRNKRLLISKKIDLWTKNANHIIGGCDWVEYLYYWDTLMLAHFSIDTSIGQRNNSEDIRSKTFRVFHAPNHKAIKGTQHLIDVVENLRSEGYDIELLMLSKVPNEEIIQAISEVDIVADQFIVGWYAMFALEAMTLGKPVMCFLRNELIHLYTNAGLIEKDEIPIINTSVSQIEDNLKWAYNNRDELIQIGKDSKEYVKNHHSIEVIGKTFDIINRKLLECLPK